MSRYGWIRTSLSGPRFQPYLRACVDNYGQALELYRWNVEVSAGFYAPLHCLEVGLRNALHSELSVEYGRPDWWAVCSPGSIGERRLAEAAGKLKSAGAVGSPSADDVVAALPFGFWVLLLSRSNDAMMWRPALYRAFRPLYRGSRRDLHAHLDHLRLFRNRIMHHEPIHHRDLRADRRRIHELVNYLSPELGSELVKMDQLPGIFERSPHAGSSREP